MKKRREKERAQRIFVTSLPLLCRRGWKRDNVKGLMKRKEKKEKKEGTGNVIWLRLFFFRRGRTGELRLAKRGRGEEELVLA